jgi:hypothetical protein
LSSLDGSFQQTAEQGKRVRGDSSFNEACELFFNRVMCRNTTNHLDVMLSESEASAFPTGYEKADSSAEFILSQTKGLGMTF